ncbi:EAL domain-containing protein, partial [Escherichia coli]
KPGLSIVAEGVETQEQADLMICKGVHFLQGYLYSPPVPGNKFISEWVMKAVGCCKPLFTAHREVGSD